MNKKLIYLATLLLLNHFIVFPKPAQAVVPPDFIFNISSQIAQISSISLIFLTAVFGTFFQFFKTRFYAIKHKKTVLAATIALVLIATLTGSYFYATYRQKAEYQKWLEQSKKPKTALAQPVYQITSF
jgi:hypothetical protein